MAVYTEINRRVEAHTECIMRLLVLNANGAPVSGARIKVFAGLPPYWTDDVPFRVTDASGLLGFVAFGGPMPEDRDYYMQIIDTAGANLSDPIKFPYKKNDTKWITVTAAMPSTGGGTPGGPAPDLVWDPRLTAELNISLQPANVADGQLYWKLIRANYLPPGDDPGTAQGRVNIYYTVLDQNGQPRANQRVWQAWPDDRADKFTDPNGNTDFVMSGDSSFDPKKGQHGPYTAYVDQKDFPSDTVVGLGLPLKQHVVYELTWQKAVKGTAVPQTHSAVRGTISNVPAGTVLTLTSSAGTQMTQTDASGNYAFISLSPGTYSLTVGYANIGVINNNIVLDGTNEVEVNYTYVPPPTKNSAVRGVITNAPAGTQVTLTSSAGAQTTTTDAGGNYAFANLGAGTYALSIAGAGVVNSNILLDGTNTVTFNYTLPIIPPTQKPLTHYLYFGPASNPGILTNLIIALDYIIRFAPVSGFSLTEAMNAQHVTIVGGTNFVSDADAQKLRDAGCQVARLSAADSYALEKLFAQLVASGNPYP